MIILDTNVVSEPLKPRPASQVLDWLDEQRLDTLFLTAISLAELRYGVAALPEGKRRSTLHEALEGSIVAFFANRILAFDAECASAYAIVRARAAAVGRAIGQADGYIAAIAAAHGFSVATRDVSPFEAAGVSVIDPWRAR